MSGHWADEIGTAPLTAAWQTPGIEAAAATDGNRCLAVAQPIAADAARGHEALSQWVLQRLARGEAELRNQVV